MPAFLCQFRHLAAGSPHQSSSLCFSMHAFVAEQLVKENKAVGVLPLNMILAMPLKTFRPTHLLMYADLDLLILSLKPIQISTLFVFSLIEETIN